jgi:hypothetical protein
MSRLEILEDGRGYWIVPRGKGKEEAVLYLDKSVYSREDAEEELRRLEGVKA